LEREVVSFSGSLDVFIYRFGVSIWWMRKRDLEFHWVWVSRLDGEFASAWVLFGGWAGWVELGMATGDGNDGSSVELEIFRTRLPRVFVLLIYLFTVCLVGSNAVVIRYSLMVVSTVRTGCISVGSICYI
jgi:hypothetical protein